MYETAVALRGAEGRSTTAYSGPALGALAGKNDEAPAPHGHHRMVGWVLLGLVLGVLEIGKGKQCDREYSEQCLW